MPAPEESTGPGSALRDTEPPSSSLKRLKFLSKQLQPRAALTVTVPAENCVPLPKEKVIKISKKNSKRKAEELVIQLEDPALEEWHESPKKSPRKMAAVSKVNKFLTGVAPWKEGGQKGFITPPLLSNMSDQDTDGDRDRVGDRERVNERDNRDRGMERERERVVTLNPSGQVYSHELPEDHEVADVLLKLLSPVNATPGSKLFTFGDDSLSHSSTPFTSSDRQVHTVPLSKSDETDGELTELCVRHNTNMTAVIAPLALQPLHVKKEQKNTFEKIEKNGNNDLKCEKDSNKVSEKCENQTVSRNWLKTDSKGLLNHFRSLSALADLATTELISPSPSPPSAAQCVLLPRPSGGGLVGFSRLNTPLKIMTVNKSLFRPPGNSQSDTQLQSQSQLQSPNSLSSSDGQWVSGQTSRSHSRSSADTSRGSGESPISISPDSLSLGSVGSEGSGSVSGSDSCLRSIVSTGESASTDIFKSNLDKDKEGDIIRLSTKLT